MKKLTKILVLLLILPLLFVVSCSTTSDGGTNDSSTLQDITEVYLNSETFEYDGQVHSLVVNGPLPGGITIDYTNNDKVDAGVYEVVATLSGEGYNTLSLTATLTITQATLPVQFLDQSFIYDGTEKEITIVGDLPNGVTVSYENNKLTDAGETTATAHFTSTNTNYNVPETMTAKLTVAKSDYPISFSDHKTVYNGKEQEIVINKQLPEWITVRYENNKLTDAGEILATAYLTSTNANYSIPEKLTAKLTIEKAEYKIDFEDQFVTYDGNEHELTISNQSLPKWITVRYENNKLTNAGEIEATAYPTCTNPNYYVPEKLTAKLTVKKAIFNTDSVHFYDKQFIYDGTEKELVVDESYEVPNFISLSYENNKLTEAKTIVAKAKITLLDTNNYKLEKDYVEAKLSVVPAANYVVNENNTITITSNNTNATNTTKDLYIPSTVNGMSVIEIAPNAFNRCHYTTIYLPESISKIGANAFAYSSNLTNINIPSNVTVLEDEVFAYTNITEITLPEGLVSIGNKAFYAANLIHINLPNNLKTIGDNAFEYNDLTDVTIPLSVEYVGYNAFSNLSKVYTDNNYMSSWHPEWLSVDYNHTIDDIVIKTNDSNIYKDDLGFIYRFISVPTSIGKSYYEIIDYKGTESRITIPSTYNNLNVEAIYNYAFKNNNVIEYVDARTSNLTQIGNSAFEGCVNLKGILLNDNIYIIGIAAFKDCTSLLDFTIPKALDIIQISLFENCVNLRNVSMNSNLSTISIRAFKNCSSLKDLRLPTTINHIGSEVFYGCTSLNKIDISSVTGTIYPSAFEGCTSLVEINIPYQVTEISCNVFKGCTSLSKVYFSNFKYLTTISHNAFEGCTSLTSVNIPDGVTVIDSETFRGCTSLTNITIPKTVTNIYSSAFEGCTSLTNITIPNSVASIGRSAFEGCTSLTTVNIPDGITTIDSKTFRGCTSLTNITIPNSVTSIGWFAFEGCINLTNITIPNSVTNIESSAFKGCTSLTNITIPNSVTNIESSAFEGCTSLSNINLSNSLTTIGYNAFKDCTSLTKLTLPSSLNKASGLSSCTNLKEIIIEDGATKIWSSAFEDCISLTSITIPESVTSIAFGAFKGCTSLSNITLPERLECIDSYTFNNCTSLTNITIPNSVTSIGWSAFKGCINLTNITIPQSVTSIELSAFEGCNSLENIFIPSSVINVGISIFKNCTNLKTIYCEAAEEPAVWADFWIGAKTKPEVIWGYKPKQ